MFLVLKIILKSVVKVRQRREQFEKGKDCGALLDRVYEAKMRLAEKLGNQEDKDVEIIVDYMNKIMRILCQELLVISQKEGDCND